MTLIDRNFLRNQAPAIRIERLPSPISVQGLGSNTHQSGEFVNLTIYLPGTDGRTAVIDGKPISSRTSRQKCW